MVLALDMGWRHLLFANWPVDPAIVADHLPESLSVDTHDGDAWLSVIPFTNVDVRPKGLPAAAGVDMPELNLRTYVTCDGSRGIYFFSLDASLAPAVLGARAFHHLPYYYADIELDVRRDASDGRGGRVRFTSRRRQPGDRPAHFDARYGPSGSELDAPDGSLARFIADRFRFFTEAPDGSVRYTDVDHDAWTLYPAEMTVERNTLFRANGFAHPESEPTLYYSPGVDVVASRNRRWR
jgi:uncharacterized protein YqjF (DUF2071 family)